MNLLRYALKVAPVGLVASALGTVLLPYAASFGGSPFWLVLSSIPAPLGLGWVLGYARYHREHRLHALAWQAARQLNHNSAQSHQYLSPSQSDVAIDKLRIQIEALEEPPGKMWYTYAGGVIDFQPE